jgi:23S rRNA pseudouridine1911/1915/1917 synthase
LKKRGVLEFKADRVERVDKFLSIKLNIARNQIEYLIKNRLVKINNIVVKKGGVKIKKDDLIEVEIKKAKKEKKEVDFEIPILYEDEEVLVINKPPGIVVHPAPSVKEATVVDWLKSKNFSLSTLAGEERFGIVHRIDKDTSGALIIAKTNKAHTFLSQQLKNKTLGRYYIMLLNIPLKDAVCVNKPIARNPNNRLKMAVIKGGRDAKTLFVPVFKNLAVAKLFTGRTHQIRVHLKSIGRYILGDGVYGEKDGIIKRTMLHAKELYFIHPNGKKLSIIAPIFSDFLQHLPKGIENEQINNISNRFVNFEWMCK